MNRLLLRNIRCFVEPEAARLAPLTIIVGENSTGKSTLLGSARLVWQAASGETDLDFNAEPFEFGGFDQVSNYRGGRPGRAKEFELGFSSVARLPGSEPRVRDLFERAIETNDELAFRVAFVRGDVQPAISRLSLASGEYKFVQHVKNGSLSTISLTAPSFNIDITKDTAGDQAAFVFEGPPLVRSPILRFLAPTIRTNARRGKTDLSSAVIDRDYEQIVLLSDRLRRALTHEPLAFAPVRTKPLRTYNPSRTSPDPEGNHAPMVLASRFFSKPDEWQALKLDLEEFGRDSGLFHSINIRSLGNADGDPFQVTVQNHGSANINLADVGYGVSQALPILVDGLTAKRRRLFLVQQPEVHLHPRGQAALATFFAKLIKSRSMRFLIETHSDYLVDRVRFEIREGRLKPSEVSLIYLERHGHPVIIHNVSIDSRGNLTNSPPGYRSFFLEEDERLMSSSS